MIKNNITTMLGTSLAQYDTSGAMAYIVIVLLWYSLGIAFILGMQILTSADENEHPDKRQIEFSISNLHDDSRTKEILQELVDRKNRDRLWKIYLGATTHTGRFSTLSENDRIRHMRKRLATIDRNHQLIHDELFPSINKMHHVDRGSNHELNISETSSCGNSLPRRRSSLDEEILGPWRERVHQSKFDEDLPQHINKLFIQ